MTASVACHWVRAVMGKPLAEFQTSKSGTERLMDRQTDSHRQADRQTYQITNRQDPLTHTIPKPATFGVPS